MRFPPRPHLPGRVFLEANTLDAQGLVFDFTELKRRVKSWIDDNWDHSFLLNSRDTELINGLATASKGRIYQFDEENPSCEVLSRVLYTKIVELCGVSPVKVRLWESLDQFAEYSGGQ